MNNDVVIKVENIGKRYEIGEKSSFVTLRDKLIELPRRIFQGPAKTKAFWALKNVSFEIKRGEVVGIIGRNGAGKSTLLKILARITEPTTGKITMKGRVASMLEVGTGFNPELTGRENIYLNGAIIGMKKKEIESKFEEIVAFSGVEKFLDTPVKHYSSGMYVRLAFAVAAHLDADILLIDEVLAVGDSEFQKKCLGKMSDLSHMGKTVVIVSHNPDITQNLCEKGILLTSGNIQYFGEITNTYKQYNKVISKPESEKTVNGKYSILINKASIISDLNTYNLTLALEIESKIKTQTYVSIGIDNDKHERVVTISSEFYSDQLNIKKGKQIITCNLHGISLKKGRYLLSILFNDEHQTLEYFDKYISVDVIKAINYPNNKTLDDTHGNILVKQLWRIE